MDRTQDISADQNVPSSNNEIAPGGSSTTATTTTTFGTATTLVERKRTTQRRSSDSSWLSGASSNTSEHQNATNYDNGTINKSTTTRPLGRTRPARRTSFGSMSSIGEGTEHTSRRTNMWTKLAKKSDVWNEDEDEDEEKEMSFKYLFINCWASLKFSFRRTWDVTRAHPSILLWTVLTFAALCTVGIVLVFQFANQEEESRRDEALDTAIETANFFSDTLDRAILPLFSMAQFVQQLEIFQNIPNQIGPAGEEQSLPFLPPLTQGGPVSHRNVTDVCGNPEIVERFNDIASTIKRDAGMEGILVNLQLAPFAVVCMLYPLNNTEDFEPPVFLDNTGAIGHDLLTDPNRKFIAQATVPSHEVVIAGPLPLRQCTDCDPTVERALIARLSIPDPDVEIELDGVVYNKWGFAVALINWQALIDRSEISERFAMKRQQFRLTRTDRNEDADTGKFVEKVVILAESPDFDIPENEIVDTKLNTTNNEWRMEVGYSDGIEPGWKSWGIAIVVVASFCISYMLMVILVQKHSYGDLLKDILPPRALRKIKRGQTVVEKYNMATVFFSDICGYTTMSAEMTPIQVMKMLNAFYSEVDKIATKHNVHKIQTIGDVYMVAGGVPDRCLGPEGATKVSLFALETMAFVEKFRTADGAQLSLRAGINSGPLVAGVVGTKRPQYTVFGDTVNAAARMETTSHKGKIQISDTTSRLLRDSCTHCFQLKARGGVDVKGKGKMQTWFIEGATMGYDGAPKVGVDGPPMEVEKAVVADSDFDSDDSADPPTFPTPLHTTVSIERL